MRKTKRSERVKVSGRERERSERILLESDGWWCPSLSSCQESGFQDQHAGWGVLGVKVVIVCCTPLH